VIINRSDGSLQARILPLYFERSENEHVRFERRFGMSLKSETETQIGVFRSYNPGEQNRMRQDHQSILKARRQYPMGPEQDFDARYFTAGWGPRPLQFRPCRFIYFATEQGGLDHGCQRSRQRQVHDSNTTQCESKAPSIAI
jgi:hypothetical protein